MFIHNAASVPTRLREFHEQKHPHRELLLDALMEIYEPKECPSGWGGWIDHGLHKVCLEILREPDMYVVNEDGEDPDKIQKVRARFYEWSSNYFICIPHIALSRQVVSSVSPPLHFCSRQVVEADHRQRLSSYSTFYNQQLRTHLGTALEQVSQFTRLH